MDAIEAVEDFKNKYYFLLAAVSKKSIYDTFLPDIAYSIAKALTDPRLHIEAETDVITVVSTGDVIDCTDT